jgi:hypothetical protein
MFSCIGGPHGDPNCTEADLIALANGSNDSGEPLDFGGKWEEWDPNVNNENLQCDDNSCFEFRADGTELSGDISFSDTWADAEKYIIVKSGHELYLFDIGTLSDVSWTFFGQTLSDISAYRIVPLPAAVWLFGTAIAGLAFLRRRRQGLVNA